MLPGSRIMLEGFSVAGFFLIAREMPRTMLPGSREVLEGFSVAGFFLTNPRFRAAEPRCRAFGATTLVAGCFLAQKGV